MPEKDNMEKEYKHYEKAVEGLNVAAKRIVNKKINSINEYIKFDKKANEVIGTFIEDAEKSDRDYVNFGLLGKLCDKKNELTGKVLNHIKNNGGFFR